MNVRYHVGKCPWHISNALTHYLLIATKAYQKNRPFGLYKGGEKLAESEEDLLEHRTDGTDAFDTLYIGAEKFPYRESYAFPTTGIL